MTSQSRLIQVLPLKIYFFLLERPKNCSVFNEDGKCIACDDGFALKEMKWSLACHDAICIPCKYMRFNSQCRNQTSARGTCKTIQQIWNCLFSFWTAPIFIKPQFSQTNNSRFSLSMQTRLRELHRVLALHRMSSWLEILHNYSVWKKYHEMYEMPLVRVSNKAKTTKPK